MTLQRYSHTGAAPPTGLTSNITSSALSFAILSAAGYPTGSSGLFVLSLDPGTGSEEKVLCSSISGTTVTVESGGRGYDNTVASAHNSGSVNVEHVWSAAEADDASRHIYGNLPGPTLSDDHINYALANGGRGIVCLTVPMGSPQSFSSGAPAIVQFNQVVVDSASGFNVSTYMYTVPHTANYRVAAQVTLNTTTGTAAIWAQHNAGATTVGPPGEPIVDPVAAATYLPCTVDSIIGCTANDTLSIYCLWTNTGTAPLLVDTTRTQFKIVEVH